MKKIENYGVEELNQKSLTETNGGANIPDGRNLFESFLWMLDNKPRPVGKKAGTIPLNKFELR